MKKIIVTLVILTPIVFYSVIYLEKQTWQDRILSVNEDSNFQEVIGSSLVYVKSNSSDKESFEHMHSNVKSLMSVNAFFTNESIGLPAGGLASIKNNEYGVIFETIKLGSYKSYNHNDSKKEAETSLIYQINDWELSPGFHFKGRKASIDLITIEQGINMSDIYGRTPLMLATLYLFDDIVSMLINKGGNINSIDKKGRTALIYLSKYHGTRNDYDAKTKQKIFEMFSLMIDNNADTSIRDEYNKSALDYADFHEWNVNH